MSHTEASVRHAWESATPEDRERFLREPYLSRRFVMKKYLSWTDEEIIESERVLLKERPPVRLGFVPPLWWVLHKFLRKK